MATFSLVKQAGPTGGSEKAYLTSPYVSWP